MYLGDDWTGSTGVYSSASGSYVPVYVPPAPKIGTGGVISTAMPGMPDISIGGFSLPAWDMKTWAVAGIVAVAGIKLLMSKK